LASKRLDARAVEEAGAGSLAPDNAALDNAAFLAGLGERVRTLRARRGMTRRLLAQHSGVSERYIAQMEAGRGNASILLLRAVAGALDVAPAVLLAPDSDDAALLQSLLARLSPTQLREARALLMGRFGMVAAELRRGRVALIGLRGAGKSTLGKLLAEHRGVEFFELDREIEREARLSIGEIVELHGQPGYRRLERKVLERLLREHKAMVIAAGGSIVAEPGTFEMLLSQCLVVWVRAAPEVHMKRVIDQGDLRPMADSRAAMADLRAILASREALYAQADLSMDTSAATVAQSFAHLKALVE
jgi:XRE family aerobic/anaerobic benzoate catabolism transcriptional regulator